jgi:hypothetical protein
VEKEKAERGRVNSMPECNSSFLKDLKNLDRRLSVKFNGEHHVITYDRGHGEPVNVHRVSAEDGGYRQPDNRDLAILKGGDLEEGESMELRLKKRAYACEEMRKHIRKRTREMIRDSVKDDRNQLRRWITDRSNGSKGNAEFRRISHKPGKNVVRTIEAT